MQNKTKSIIILSKMLESGGVEVSLINFINELKKDPNLKLKLLLLREKGVYIDKFKNLIEIDTIKFDNEAYNPTIGFKELKRLKDKMIRVFIKLNTKISLNKANKIRLRHSKKYNEKVDLVIDFHGYGYLGTMYAAEKIEAKKKITFIHDENIFWMDRIKEYMCDYDKFFAVSNSCLEITKKQYPEITEKLTVFHNILNKNEIIKKSKETIEKLENKFKILTIGRLEFQKGYDILIDIAKKIKDENIDFIWYIIGNGSLKNEIHESIIKNGMEKNIILLGMKDNPYPYIKQCDIYVQPSRHEGYGIAIAEARILCKPIIATKINSIAEQINNKNTGILCELNSNLFKKEIIELYTNKQKRDFLINNLMINNREEFNDISKIYDLL